MIRAGHGYSSSKKLCVVQPSWPAVGAEADLVHADVEDRRLGCRPHLVEEEPQLPAAGAERDGVGELHVPREGTARGGQPPEWGVPQRSTGNGRCGTPHSILIGIVRRLTTTLITSTVVRRRTAR